jgi:hypothetical protein
MLRPWLEAGYSIPEIYERLLIPLIFESYALASGSQDGRSFFFNVWDRISVPFAFAGDMASDC